MPLQCSKGDSCSFRHDVNKRGKITPSNPSPNSFIQQNQPKSSRTRSPRGKSPSGRMFHCPARITSKEFSPIHSVKNGILLNACSTSQKIDADFFGEKCSYAHRQVQEQSSERIKNNGDKSTVAMLKSTRQLGCVLQDMEPPKSSSIFRKSSNIRKPIRCVEFTAAFARRANSRDQNPSFGKICPGDPHQRNSNAEFVLDSGASMQMISKKDLDFAELETVTTSRGPMTGIKANGEVQTIEKVTVYVRELDIFLTMKLHEDTPVVLSLGKLCHEHGYSYKWINGQKPHLINGIRIQCNTENFVPFVALG